MGEGFFKIINGGDLAVAEAGFVKSGEGSEASAERGGLGESLGEGLRTVEGKDFARAGLGVALVSEAGDGAGCLIEERKWGVVVDPLELRGGVTGSLFFDDGDVLSFFLALGLDDTDGLAVDKEDVVGGAGVCLLYTSPSPRDRG